MDLKILDRGVKKKGVDNGLAKVINKLPYNTVTIKKELAASGIMSRGMVDKWYAGKTRSRDLLLLRKVADFLNKHFPDPNGVPITVDDFVNE